MTSVHEICIGHYTLSSNTIHNRQLTRMTEDWRLISQNYSRRQPTVGL